MRSKQPGSKSPALGDGRRTLAKDPRQWTVSFCLLVQSTRFPANNEDDCYNMQVKKGPYESIGLAYNIIIPYIEEYDYAVTGPPIVTWLDDNPREVLPKDRRTEILMPVQKMKK